MKTIEIEVYDYEEYNKSKNYLSITETQIPISCIPEVGESIKVWKPKLNTYWYLEVVEVVRVFKNNVLHLEVFVI